MKKLAVLGLLSLFTVKVSGQGHLSGDLMTNAIFYNRDPAINADTNAFYEKLLSGGEAWLSLRYSHNGFTAFLRADAFQNSNLYSPGTPHRGFGIGAWSLSKEINELTVTGGYIYDQVGSGILFRSYEDRGLLIDNALVGLHLKYNIDEHVTIKAFAGQQKNVFNFSRFEPIIKGLNVEGDYSLGKAHITPGIGALNRTLDNQSYDDIYATVQSYDTSEIFTPLYNTYAFTAYNNLTVGDFSWYAEGVYKTKEAIIESPLSADLVNKAGSVIYSTLGYARKGVAVNITGKRTENFLLRTSPNEPPPRGLINLQPIVARLRPQRLMSRFTPQTIEHSELALSGDVLMSPNDKIDITLTYTHINTLEDVTLYREMYAEFNYHGFEQWAFQGGVQILEYNQSIYLVKPGYSNVKAVTPFAEVTYRFNDKKSIRVETEYMHTEQDMGPLIFGLIEYNIAPRWSFSVSDMYTLDLHTPNIPGITEPQHLYNIFVAHTNGPHRFTASYGKQVQGINCSGGVCRFEPAFSGLKIGITSSF